MDPRTPTRRVSSEQRIVRGMLTARFTTLSVSEIAAHAGLSSSTVRKHLPILLQLGIVRHTSWQGVWTLHRPAALAFVGVEA